MTYELVILITVILNLSLMCLCFKNKKNELEGKKGMADWTFIVSGLLVSTPAIYISRLAFGFNKGKTKFFLWALIPLLINVAEIALIVLYLIKG